MKFLRYLSDIIKFNSLPKENKKIVFYSEGKPYWAHLKGLVAELLNLKIPICYISSDINDPGMKLSHECYKAFLIDEGLIRNWLFENIQADIMVMTMPDLHQYQVKRSKYPVHYVYVQHSLVSLHMVYREGAFDYYDTIFCSGSHHVREMNEIIEQHNLSTKNIVEHGYGRLDDIIKESQNISSSKDQEKSVKTILIAPSWGNNGVIETVGDSLVEVLIQQGYDVILRPHPQTVKFASDKLNVILDKYSKNTQFKYDIDMLSKDSLRQADIMISDWSGAALDYAFGLKKPVLFIDVPRKINNENFHLLTLEPFESAIRDKIGVIISTDELDNISEYIQKAQNKTINNVLISKYVFNLGESDKVGASYLKELLTNL